MILIAVLLALPLAYFSVIQYLQSFAYRVELSWGHFLFVAVFALLIGWLTVAWYSSKVARTSPILALREE